MDNKPTAVLVNVAPDLSRLIMYDGSVKMVRGAEPPIIAQLRASQITSLRVGVANKGGKPLKAGMFSKTANAKRAVCLDAEGDTLVQLETASEDDVAQLIQGLTGMLEAAAAKRLF